MNVPTAMSSSASTEHSRPSGVVTLLSDLGTTDGYVAAVKGAILSANLAANIVDVTHHIPNGDVIEAAFQLAMVWPTFPRGSVHVVAVAAEERVEHRAIVVEIAEHYFVAADSGVLTLLFANFAVDYAIQLDHPAYGRSSRDAGFPARDVYGPVAGLIASSSLELDALGSPIESGSLVQLPWAPVLDSAEHVHAPIVSIDRYGNCRTLITRQHLPSDPSRVLVRCGAVTVRGVHSAYSDVKVGKTMALFGSHGGLEIAVRGGSAAQSWELSRGDLVVVVRD
jgi:S-adenosylmethionine hydrolase